MTWRPDTNIGRGKLYPTTTQNQLPSPLKLPKHHHYVWISHTKGISCLTTTQNHQITIIDTPKTTQVPKSPIVLMPHLHAIGLSKGKHLGSSSEAKDAVNL